MNMPYAPDPDELAEILRNLPELPEQTDDDDTGARDLILFHEDPDHENVRLAERVSYADARAYANREDTNGDGWFVGFARS
jgi:hypothetical protein